MERDFGDLIYSSVFATDLGYGENNHACFRYLSAKQKQNKTKNHTTQVLVCISHKCCENKLECVIELKISYKC